MFVIIFLGKKIFCIYYVLLLCQEKKKNNKNSRIYRTHFGITNQKWYCQSLDSMQH